ncbi:MAG: multiheme c-type cytochrome [Planctomycetota bacterium]
MKVGLVSLAVLGLATVLALEFDGNLMAQGAPTYVGSEACKECHEDDWNDFRVSGHPFKLRSADDARSWPIPLPKGYDWDDISYVIGGYGWKVRFMDEDGFIITDSGGSPGKNQFNLATGEWVDYHAGEVDKPYDCGLCHTTNYDPAGNQDGLAGITGTWALPGIQCEECHGPGSDHVAAPSSANITVDDTSLACGKCHVRGDPTMIPASGGFIRHHEQYNELLASPHKDLKCVDCHDSHKKSEFSIHTPCTQCHEDVAFKKLGKRHMERDVSCEDCHMPYASKSAVKHNTYKGDVKTHLFKITTDKSAELFNADGSLANSELPGEWACLGCHQDVVKKFEGKNKPEKAISWARKSTRKIHKHKKR